MPAPKKMLSMASIVRLLLLFGAVGALIFAFFNDDDAGPQYKTADPRAEPFFVVDKELEGQRLTAEDFNGELLINLEDDRDDLEAVLEEELGLELELNSIHADDDNLFKVKVAASQMDALIDRIEDIDGVENVEPNAQVRAFGEPNDPLYVYQWNFEQIKAEEAWAMASGEGTVVAVIDTGVAYEEGDSKKGILVPDLKGAKLRSGYDFVDDDDAPYDKHGHGTHVAGTIAQVTDNDYGVAGVAYNAQIMPLRVLNEHGFGNNADIADSVRFAADNGADVINMSLGGGYPSRELAQAIKYAHEKGVVVVAAAGNAGSDLPSYPAAFDHVISVAATQYDRSTTFYSNYGSTIDLAAPGGNTLEDQNEDGMDDGIMQETLTLDNGQVVFEPTFALYMGTSMAAPHVAAAAALLVSAGVSNPDEVEELLTENAVDEGEAGWDPHYGHGIIDVEAALQGHVTETGLWRVGGALLLALLFMVGMKRRDSLDQVRWTFWIGLTLGAGGLFFLRLLVANPGGPLGMALAVVSDPVMGWEASFFGPGSLSPISASALLPVLLVILLLGTQKGRWLAAGFALAMGAVLFVEALRLTIDVALIPGVGGFDRTWLVVNALIAVGIGTLAMKK